MFRSLVGPAGSVDRAPAEEETLRSKPDSSPVGLVHALHVAGPNGGARFVLPNGVVTLGRDPESTIVLEDPRASRQHAALYVGEQLNLSDLGSANGTLLDGRRLAPHAPEPLALGQAFRIGDATFVVDVARLAKPAVRRLDSFTALATLLAESPSGMTVLRVRPLRRLRPLPVEMVAGSVLGADAWLLRLGCGTLLAGTSSVDGHGRALEQQMLRALSSFGIAAEVDSRSFAPGRLAGSADELRTLLSFEAARELERGSIVLLDPAMKQLERTIERVARANINVLVLGETGAGKDVVASMVHELSTRSAGPFVGINCASLPDQLLESELFGHERGAFTGAVCAKAGLLEAADGGTLFLDEIGDLPTALQAKLLRVIESRELMRLGALKPRAIDVRFVAATNCDLEADVSAGRFRQDLYYRLNGIVVHVPPLRERPSEIEPLARLFLADACERFGLESLAFSPAALTALARHGWPGNVRELRNAVERAVLVAEAAIEPIHLGLGQASLGGSPRSTPTDVASLLGDDASERERITRALEACAGNQSRAAKILQMPRRTLVRRIAQLGLPRPRV